MPVIGQAESANDHGSCIGLETHPRKIAGRIGGAEKDAWISAELLPLLAIAMAALDENGFLLEANAGFLRLINDGGKLPVGAQVARFFQQPTLSALNGATADANGEIHRGLMTIGDSGRMRTLRARVWRAGACLRVQAEFDVQELEQLYDTVLELNRNYADVQAELAQSNFKLQQREAQVLALSLTDVMTGVGNRRRLEQALPLEINRVERSGTRLCALMADLDYFKRINDGHGHEAGDKVLTVFGALLRGQTRPTDIVARYGGEEFVILMPNSGLAQALVAAERIRETLATTRIEPLTDAVTASFGVAELAAGEKGDALLRRIDAALYAAKHAGRNRVLAG